jgi:hypothetical protein
MIAGRAAAAQLLRVSTLDPLACCVGLRSAYVTPCAALGAMDRRAPSLPAGS